MVVLAEGTAQAKVGGGEEGFGLVTRIALVCLEQGAPWKEMVVSWEPRLSWTGEGLESQRLQG